MNNKWLASITVCALALSLLPACGQNWNPFQSPAKPEPTRPSLKNVFIYEVPEMDRVKIETVQYLTLAEPTIALEMDIYYPSKREAGALLPAVIIANAFPLNSKWIRNADEQQLSQFYQGMEGWGRAFAANGLIAVAYDTIFPNDLEAVVKHIQQNSTELGIDGSHLGLFGSSFNTFLASSFAYQENREYLKFAVFDCGYILTPENYNRETADAAANEIDFFGSRLPEVKQLRTDLPVLMVRCGKDWFYSNLQSFDRLAKIAAEQGVPLTLIRFDEGEHGFEWADTSSGEVKTKGIEIIKQTLEFMKANAFDE